MNDSFINIDGVNICYSLTGSGENIVLLHGWGQNKEMMMPFYENLKDRYNVISIDLPGFGKSDEIKNKITIYEYSEYIKKMLDKLNIVNPIFIGHSFGGRLSIILSSKYNTKKVILLGAPCVRIKKFSFKVFLYKIIKRIPLPKNIKTKMKSKFGSSDYNSASEYMRHLLVNTVNEDLSECARNITSPCLLIWGDKDSAAPIENARMLEKLLKDVKFIEIKGASHYAYLEHKLYVLKKIDDFIGDKK